MKKLLVIVVLVLFSCVKAYAEIIEFKKCWEKNFEQTTTETTKGGFDDLADYNKVLEIKFHNFSINTNLNSLIETINKKDKIKQSSYPIISWDTEFLKAQETSADTSSIVANKNTLRDLPLKVDEAKTLDAIKNVWNDLLGDK